ncbi:uncharacterized protein LOC123213925 [Mangifera indica]|uniref:uncharacterized protein LOC123213925 n=1 Tax=Mangifera indica TaxID=29780 RepID=UPI001CFB022B|nr:uncharacterized protein LOC123213925 [Mangifera indica]
MGSQCNPTKPRFDITMSRRTRKPIFNLDDPTSSVDQVEEDNDHKSLKQLINRDETSKKKNAEESKGRNSLGEHFTEEEKQLQLVKLQQQKGVKLKGMVNRYVKVLSHLIKVNRDPRTIGSTKKPLLRLKIFSSYQPTIISDINLTFFWPSLKLHSLLGKIR